MTTGTPAVGILANPMSGRDVRRLAARASTTTPEIKRDQVARAVVGAAAGGAERVVIVRDPFRISTSAVENLTLHLKVETIDVGAELRAADSARAALAMRDAGCRALVVLGGDGTNRVVARAWRGAPLVPLSTGTNNVFPVAVEATAAGAAAGLVASGRVALEEASDVAKTVRVSIDGEDDDLALIDAVQLVDDPIGNLMPFEPERMRRIVLARAEPSAVGTSPIGGLLQPCRADDDFGVVVSCASDGGRRLLAPISPGLYRPVHVRDCRRLALHEVVEIEGPGVLAFDGDRERALAAGQRARLRVERDGPRVIDVDRTLAVAARAGHFVGREHWHDGIDALGGLDCC
jgi:hypothetical protein